MAVQTEARMYQKLKYLLPHGAVKRVASKNLKSQSYVSMVANGTYSNSNILKDLIEEAENYKAEQEEIKNRLRAL
ncbi:hypothetical protein [Xanthovirga aplysinae]|uniref:hypothetical protein n=1 Tax=Xanthovirga aplysinae TaxID=2529853 RepID=UPI0012BD5BB3|nr:hypothetical protein [Xanthovirga aplysinae]MTI31076.1 hypothetical protein [Xanthovirga aplysinae]